MLLILPMLLITFDYVIDHYCLCSKNMCVISQTDHIFLMLHRSYISHVTTVIFYVLYISHVTTIIFYVLYISPDLHDNKNVTVGNYTISEPTNVLKMSILSAHS